MDYQKEDFMVSKANLDKVICDVEIGQNNNTNTYREHIHQIERHFRMLDTDSELDEMTDNELRSYLKELEYVD